MSIQRLVLMAAVLSLAAVPIESGAAADAVKLNGNLVLKPDSNGAPTGIVFTNGDVLTTAPKDGKSVLNGSGAPSAPGNLGDFYIDTANNQLYGPYNGSSWGTGVSLVGPQGIQGIQGFQGIQGPAGASPFTLNGGNAVLPTGSVGIGTSSPNAAAALDVTSTSKGFLPPRMTTLQRDAITSPPVGLMIYNTTTNRVNVYNVTASGSVWSAVPLVQQDLLGQTAGTTSFNTNNYYFTGVVATHTGTISSVDLRVATTGNFQLLIKDAARNTLRLSSVVAVNNTGLVTINFSPVAINAGEYIGFFYSGQTQVATASANTFFGASDPPTTPSTIFQLSISAKVDYIN